MTLTILRFTNFKMVVYRPEKTEINKIQKFKLLQKHGIRYPDETNIRASTIAQRKKIILSYQRRFIKERV